jgi:hypothetical protein
MIRMATLLLFACLAGTIARAHSWSGALVNAKCWDSEERNINPHDSLTNVDRDRGMEVRFCSPNAKTKSFALVDHDGYTFHLDVGGNAKAADLVRHAGKKPYYFVNITGQAGKRMVRVDSISMTP